MRYKYGVVLYQPAKHGDITEANPKTAVIYYGDDISLLTEAVKEYIEQFDLREEDFIGGQVFDPVDGSTFIGRITYGGQYKQEAC